MNINGHCTRRTYGGFWGIRPQKSGSNSKGKYGIKYLRQRGKMLNKADTAFNLVVAVLRLIFNVNSLNNF